MKPLIGAQWVITGYHSSLRDKVYSLLLGLSGSGDKTFGSKASQRKLVVWAAFLAKLSHLLPLIQCVLHVESNKQNHGMSDHTEQAGLGLEIVVLS